MFLEIAFSPKKNIQQATAFLWPEKWRKRKKSFWKTAEEESS